MHARIRFWAENLHTLSVKRSDWLCGGMRVLFQYASVPLCGVCMRPRLGQRDITTGDAQVMSQLRAQSRVYDLNLHQ
jgi:hypothetical protein